jgi:hypothetical protein
MLSWSCWLSVFQLISFVSFGESFVPSNQFRRQVLSSSSSCPRQAKSSPDESENIDDDEDALLQDDDWRSFRAKLVMNEKKPDSPSSDGGTSGTAMSSPVEDGLIVDDDLDGIGSLFRDEFVQTPTPSTATEQTTTKSTTAATSTASSSSSSSSSSSTDPKVAGMTPLDPSQWAYDSGDVIESGAVILGGVEQA